MKKLCVAVGLWLCVVAVGPVPVSAQPIGTDITGINLCLYGDCEARGSYAADVYGWPNPATLPFGTLPFVARGVFASTGYFRLNVGDIGADVTSGTATLAYDPFIFQVNAVYAEADGWPRSLPAGVNLRLRTRIVRLAAAVDLGRTSLGAKGLSLGLITALPGLESNSRISLGGLTLMKTTEKKEIDLTLGLHWRGGKKDWFAVGAFVDRVRNHVTVGGLDFTTGTFHAFGATNAWFTRAGVSLLPFVPMDLADAATPLGELASEVRLGADFEHQNIAVPMEGSRRRQTGYLGVDARVIPDALNPLSDYVRLYVIAGADTNGGWGIGPGIYGNGPLQFLSCNPAYSSRPITGSLGSRLDVWAASCSITIPF